MQQYRDVVVGNDYNNIQEGKYIGQNNTVPIMGNNKGIAKTTMNKHNTVTIHDEEQYGELTRTQENGVINQSNIQKILESKLFQETLAKAVAPQVSKQVSSLVAPTLKKISKIESKVGELHDYVQNNIQDIVEKTVKKTAKKNASDVIVLPSMTREERLQRRNRIPVNDPNLLGIKEVIVKVGEKEDGVIDLTKNRKSTTKKFIDDVLYKRFYRVPFGSLTMRQRRVRMRELSTNILSACIDRVEYKHNHDKYLHLNN